MNIPNVVWIVSEDAVQATPAVTDYLNELDLCTVYLQGKLAAILTLAQTSYFNIFHTKCYNFDPVFKVGFIGESRLLFQIVIAAQKLLLSNMN